MSKTYGLYGVVLSLVVACGDDSSGDSRDLGVARGSDGDIACPDGCDPAATCSLSVAGAECQCPAGYEDVNGDGTRCMDIDECASGTDYCDARVGSCKNEAGSFSCTCPAGYTDSRGDGSLCTAANGCPACDPDVGMCDATNGMPTCRCPDGYQDSDGDGSLCTDIDECAAGADDCDSDVGVCSNEDGGFTCACPDGYTNTNSDGTVCTDIDECATNDDDCDAMAGVCTNTYGSFTCACRDGYTDSNGDGTLCTNINECTANTDDCDATVGVCTDTAGSYSCACPSGYADTHGDGTLCTNIDECATSTHNCDPTVGICTDSTGSFSCACPPIGYTDTNGDGTLCANIDECATSTDDCDPTAGICTDSAGSFSCACPPTGYTDTNGDGTLCEQFDLYYASASQPFLFEADQGKFAGVGCKEVTMPPFTVNGINAMASHPLTGEIYTVIKVSAGPPHLAILDLETAVATDIGSLGDNLATITFTPNGTTLYGATGSSATVPETLYTIDPATASKTMVQALGSGSGTNGEIIAFSRDGRLFHWSGSNPVTTETINIGGVTPITRSGFPDTGETFGAVWWPNHVGTNGIEPVFLTSDINASFHTMTTTGEVSAAYGPAFDNARGLVFAPNYHFVLGPTPCPIVP